MAEEKNVNNDGQSSKKSSRGRKTSALKPQKENAKSAVNAKSADAQPAAAFAGKIDCMADEVRNNPIKSFDKKDRPSLIQSYEKLIAHLVREINNSRQ
ncbi:MAG: hypothetical protein HZB37_01485 [Planctomycetes bacterium]|nr:hypothetical protein [Planctomycetota bacterium]